MNMSEVQVFNGSTEVKTMLSTEIVKLINNLREGGAAELRHADFMAKVVRVLGIEPAKEFVSQYKAANGQMQPCYTLPEREAKLMVMSESYKVQAAVLDELTSVKETIVNSNIHSTTTPAALNYAQEAVLAKDTLVAFGIEPTRDNMCETLLNKTGIDYNSFLPALPKPIVVEGINPYRWSNRNTVTELSEALGVNEYSIDHVLYMEGYIGVDDKPSSKAFGMYDCIQNKLYWSLPLVMRLLNAEGYKIKHK
jgi:hypothetical protein